MAVTGATSYKATYTATKKSYTITWLDDDDSQIDTTTVEYGVVPTHADPTKAATDEYTYTFAGWTPTVVAVTGATSYKATYTATKKSYTITWDVNGTTSTETYEYGATPSYKDGTPTKPATAQFTYTFAGWNPAISSVTGAQTYTAQFDAVEIVVPTLALAKPTIASTVLASGTSGAKVKVTVDPAAVVTATNANVAFTSEGAVTNATFTNLPWNEAVDWKLQSAGAEDLPGRFYAKGETSWFNVATNAFDDIDDLADGMKGVDKTLDPSAAGQMVRIQTCLEIGADAMEELPTGDDVGSARTGFAVAKLSDDTAPAFYAFNGTTWDKLSGAEPVANTTNDLLVVLDVEAQTARYYVEGVALYTTNAAGARTYALPMKESQTAVINGIGFANPDGVASPVVAEYDVPFEAAVGDTPYAAAAAMGQGYVNAGNGIRVGLCGCVFQSGDGLPAEAHERAEEGEERGRIGEIEQRPAEVDEQERIDMPACLRQLFEPFAEEELFEAYEHSVQSSPEDEVPARSVPEARQRPDYEQIEYLPGEAVTVAAEGDIDVLLEPGGQGDMPSAPEIGYALGDIGIIEVLQELEPEHTPETYGHIGIAAEIEVDLQSEGYHADP